jgi:hypothetical protein
VLNKMVGKTIGVEPSEKQNHSKNKGVALLK